MDGGKIDSMYCTWMLQTNSEAFQRRLVPSQVTAVKSFMNVVELTGTMTFPQHFSPPLWQTVHPRVGR